MSTQEQKKEDRLENNCVCFGEFGSRVYCSSCRNREACKHFTNEQNRERYLRYKGKYKGRGKFRKRDRY